MKKFLMTVTAIVLTVAAGIGYVRGTQHTMRVVKNQRHEYVVKLCNRAGGSKDEIKECVKTVE